MPENVQTESVAPMNFNNLVLKRWLHSIGPVRRFEVLKKLKADLQDFGLSRRQVRRGLLQLVTNSHVILTRKLPVRYGSRDSLEEDEEECKTADDLKTGENEQKSDFAERLTKEECQRNEKIDIEEACKTALVIKHHESSVNNGHSSGKDYELKTALTMHPFDKALEQLDELTSSKTKSHDKSSSKRPSVIVSTERRFKSQTSVALSKKSDKDETHLSHVGNRNTRETQRTPDLVLDKMGTDAVQTPGEGKGNCIKLNLSSCCSKKAGNYVQSEVYKKVDTVSVVEKLHSNGRTTDSKLNSSVSSKNKSSKPESNGYVLAGTEAPKIKETSPKRKSNEPTTSDLAQRKKICAFVNEYNEKDRRKRNKTRKKFRSYFGDCISVSEDEQEQDILRKRFKMRRKKDSVDSCDSGVCVVEGNATTIRVEIPINVLQLIPDSTIPEESIEDISEETAESVDTVDKSKEVTSNESTEIIDQIKELTNTIKVENSPLQDDTKADSIRKKTEKLFNEKLASDSDRNAVTQRTTILDNTDVTEQSEVNDSVIEIKAEKRTNTSVLFPDMPEICISNHNIEITGESPSKSQESHLDTKDISELLHMSFTQTQITSSGNVVSIQETIQCDITENITNEKIERNITESSISKKIDENSNLKELPKIQLTYSQNIKKEVLSNSIEEITIDSDSVELPHNTNDSIEIISTDSIHNALNNENKSLVQESELHNTSKTEKTPLNKAPQGRLRVRTSAELGARWCPTPVNTDISAAPQCSSTNTSTTPEVLVNCATSVVALVTQTIPVITSVTTAPVPTSAIEVTASENTRNSNVDRNLSESVYVTFIKIFNLIQRIRIAPLPNFNYKVALYMEFEKLRKAWNTENYVELIEEVMRILNTELVLTPPLSSTELFRYTRIVSPYNSNESQITMPVGTLNEMTLNQNRYCNSQTSKNMHISTSTMPRLQQLLCTPTGQNQASINATSIPMRQNQIPINATSIPTRQSQTPINATFIPIRQYQTPINATSVPTRQNQTPINATSTSTRQNETSINAASKRGKQKSRQNLKKKVIAQPQSNAATNSFPNNNHNTQQPNYRMQTHRTFAQQNAPNVYFVEPNATTNRNAPQSFFPQYFPTGINQQGRHIPVPVTNSSLIGQQYIPQNLIMPQVNTLYNVNAPSYPVQQNMSSTHFNMPNVAVPHVTQYQNVIQGQSLYHVPHRFPLQSASQEVAPNCVLSPTQTVLNRIPHPVPKNVQQNEPIYQRVPPPQVQMTVPQNRMSEQVPRPPQVQMMVPQNRMSEQVPTPPQVQMTVPQNRMFGQVPTPSQVQMTVPQNRTSEQVPTPLQVQITVPQNRISEQVPTPPQVQMTVPQNRISEQVPTPPQVQMTVPQNRISEQVPTPPQVQMTVPQSSMSEQVPTPPHVENTYSCKPKQPIFVPQRNNTQVSLESTTEPFDVLKYLSDIDKIIIFKQLEFYFTCTTWLQQQFTTDDWQEITEERNSLLHFKTLLKHLVEKTVRDLLQNESTTNVLETDILASIKLDVLQMVQIIVNENEGLLRQDGPSKSDKVQCTTVDVNQDSATRQENVNVIVQNETTNKEQEAMNDSQSKTVSNQARELEMLDIEKGPKNRTVEDTVLLQKNNSSIEPNLEIQTSDNNAHQKINGKAELKKSKDMHCLITTEQNLEKPEKIVENISRISEATAPTDLALKLPNKDTHQSNPHLVTVEISSNNDQVTVIDTNVITKGISINEPQNHEVLEEETLHVTDILSTENTSREVLIVTSPIIPISVESFNNTDVDTSLSEETLTSHIEDVRSISIETFERIEDVNNVSTNTEINIEEEEIKICLYCGKPSTVACSICLEAKYCSKKCFELHWGDHYKDCIPVKRRLCGV